MTHSAEPPASPHCPPVEPAADPATQVLRQFRVVFNAVRSHFQQVERRAGIGGAPVWALRLIHDRAGLGVGELAQAMDIHQSTASNLVRQLGQRGLIRSERAITDRRSVHLFIQPAGQDLLAQVPIPHEGVLPAALQRLDPATLLRLQTDLAGLIQALQADESARHIPLAEL